MAKKERQTKDLTDKDRIKLLEIQVDMLLEEFKKLKTDYMVQSKSYNFEPNRFNE